MLDPFEISPVAGIRDPEVSSITSGTRDPCPLREYTTLERYIAPLRISLPTKLFWPALLTWQWIHRLVWKEDVFERGSRYFFPHLQPALHPSSVTTSPHRSPSAHPAPPPQLNIDTVPKRPLSDTSSFWRVRPFTLALIPLRPIPIPTRCVLHSIPSWYFPFQRRSFCKLLSNPYLYVPPARSSTTTFPQFHRHHPITIHESRYRCHESPSYLSSTSNISHHFSEQATNLPFS